MKLYELLILIFTLCTGVAIGSLGKTQSSTTYNNLDIVREQLQVTQNCLNGWDSTLELLNACNDINK